MRNQEKKKIKWNYMPLRVGKICYPILKNTDKGHKQFTHTYRIQNTNHSKYMKEIFDFLINQGMQVIPKVIHLIFLLD